MNIEKTDTAVVFVDPQNDVCHADPAFRLPLPLRQLRSIEGEMPSSLAIRLNGRPLLTSMATASRLNSSVK